MWLLSLGLALILPALTASAAPPRTTGPGDPLPVGALARFGTTRFRGEGHSPGALLSPDGKLLAVGASEGILLLDSSTGKEVRRVKGDRLSLSHWNAGKFSPNGKLLVVGDHSHSIICDVEKGEVVSQVENPGRLGASQVSFSADGKLLALGGEEHGRKLSVILWDVSAKKRTKTFETRQDRRAEAALSPDGKVLATWGWMDRGQEERSIQFWDVATGKKSRTLTLEGYCTGAVFSPNGKHLLVAESGSSLSIWDVAGGTELRRFVGRRGVGAVLAYSPDGTVLAAGTPAGTVQLWDAASGRRVGQGDGPPDTRLTSLAFLPGNKVLAAGISGHSARLWEVPSGHERTPRGGHRSPVTSLAFSPEGKTLLSGGADAVLFRETATGKEVRRFEAPREERDSHREHVYLLSPEGSFLFWSQRHQGGLHAVDTHSGQEVAELQWDSGRSGQQVVFAAGRVAYAALSRNSAGKELHVTVRVWNLRTGQESRKVTLPGAGEDIYLALSPDAKVLASVAGPGFRAPTPGEVAIRDLVTGKLIAKKGIGDRVSAAGFSPDGELLAVVCAEGVIRQWDAATGYELSHLKSEGRDLYPGVFAIAPDGRTLAIAREDPDRRDGPEVLIWELASGKVRARLSGHRGGVLSLAFSPDGRTLATGGADTTVLLWDLTGRAGGSRHAKPTPSELAGLWADLDSADPFKAHRAMGRLTAAPLEAVILLTKKMKPAGGKALGEKEVQRLIDGLGADSFEVREKANEGLLQAGRAVRPALLAALKVSLDLEKKRRLEEVLKGPTRQGVSVEMLRQGRGLEVLERLGTAEARGLFGALSRGNPGARLTEDARVALTRLQRGP